MVRGTSESSILDPGSRTSGCAKESAYDTDDAALFRCFAPALYGYYRCCDY